MTQPSRKQVRPPGPGERRSDGERPFPAGELADIGVNVLEGRTAVTRPWEHCVAVSQAYAIAARQPDSPPWAAAAAEWPQGWLWGIEPVSPILKRRLGRVPTTADAEEEITAARRYLKRLGNEPPPCPEDIIESRLCWLIGWSDWLPDFVPRESLGGFADVIRPEADVDQMADMALNRYQPLWSATPHPIREHERYAKDVLEAVYLGAVFTALAWALEVCESPHGRPPYDGTGIDDEIADADTAISNALPGTAGMAQAAGHWYSLHWLRGTDTVPPVDDKGRGLFNPDSGLHAVLAERIRRGQVGWSAAQSTSGRLYCG
jgi:hypothetical protein